MLYRVASSHNWMKESQISSSPMHQTSCSWWVRIFFEENHNLSIARSDFNEQRGRDLLARFYQNKDVAIQSGETYVTLTCLSALSLHLEIHHKCNLEKDHLTISHFKNTSRLYIDRQTSKALYLLPEVQ